MFAPEPMITAVEAAKTFHFAFPTMLLHRNSGDDGAKTELKRWTTVTIVRLLPNPRCGHEVVSEEWVVEPTGRENSPRSGLAGQCYQR